MIVIMNARAGTNATEEGRAQSEKINAALHAAGVRADVRGMAGDQLTQAARDAAAEPGIDAVVAAGGDGTQSAVATALAGTSMTMGVLPLGTLNHFAKDLGIPQTLDEAAAVIATGNVRSVDVARVNGRVFVNNSSIGVYPHVVRQRDQMQETLGHGKWYAMLLAILNLFRRFPQVRLKLLVNGETFEHKTPFVFVGNNVYDIALLKMGRRRQLDGGELCLYFTNRTGRIGMFRLALRALFNRLRQDKDFNALCSREVWIDSRHKHINVSMDGEVERLQSPLHYEIWPRALNVIAPIEIASVSTTNAEVA